MDQQAARLPSSAANLVPLLKLLSDCTAVVGAQARGSCFTLRACNAKACIIQLSKNDPFLSGGQYK